MRMSVAAALLLPLALVRCDRSAGSTPPGDDGVAPAADADACDCGPAPKMPVQSCADGTQGGFTGRCVQNDDGSCDWEIRDCPEDAADGGAPETASAPPPCAKPATAFTDCDATEVFAGGCCHPDFDSACAMLGCAADQCQQMKSMPAQAKCS